MGSELVFFFTHSQSSVVACTGRRIFRRFRDFGGKIVAVAWQMIGNSR